MKIVGASVITTVKQEFMHPSKAEYMDVAAGSDGLLYCSDSKGYVTILNRQGHVMKNFKVKNVQPESMYGIALSRKGNIIVSDIEKIASMSTHQLENF